jgi:hypothetical protein
MNIRFFNESFIITSKKKIIDYIKDREKKQNIQLKRQNTKKGRKKKEENKKTIEQKTISNSLPVNNYFKCKWFNSPIRGHWVFE